MILAYGKTVVIFPGEQQRRKCRGGEVHRVSRTDKHPRGYRHRDASPQEGYNMMRRDGGVWKDGLRGKG